MHPPSRPVGHEGRRHWATLRCCPASLGWERATLPLRMGPGTEHTCAAVPAFVVLVQVMFALKVTVALFAMLQKTPGQVAQAAAPAASEHGNVAVLLPCLFRASHT